MLSSTRSEFDDDFESSSYDKAFTSSRETFLLFNVLAVKAICLTCTDGVQKETEGDEKHLLFYRGYRFILEGFPMKAIKKFTSTFFEVSSYKFFN